MKTNYEHRYIPICRIVNSIILIFLFSVSGLFSAAWKIDEAKTSFTYEWSISQEEITEFIKSGSLINSGISGSIFYQGRHYPVYTRLLKNDVDQLASRTQNKVIQEYNVLPLSTDYGDVGVEAIDELRTSTFNDFVHFQEVPGLGTLVEIMPFLPRDDGRIRCLTQADIELFSTNTTALETSDLKKENTLLSKSLSAKKTLPTQFCDLYITEPGFYQISGKDLLERDVDIEQIVPDQLKLNYWGNEIPCRVTSTNIDGQESFLEHNVVQFCVPEINNPYGDYRFNPFTNYDVIRLSWSTGNGKRYVQESSVITDNPNKFTPDMNRKFRSTIHIEENQQYQPLARLHEEELSHKYEHAFYSPSIKVGRSVSFPFEIWDPVTDSPYGADFTIRMQGLTYSVDDEMDHQIIVAVNDQQLLEDEWEGQLPNISTNEDGMFAHSNLRQGENNIQISVKGFSSNSFIEDLVLLDWLEISYDRYMIAHNNRLEFSPQHGPGTYLFQVKGLTTASDVLILKNGTNWIRGYKVAKEVNNGEETYSIYFEDLCDGSETYYVAGQGVAEEPNFGIATIDSIRYVDVLNDQHYLSSDQGDYIIVTHKDFYEKSLELLEHKASEGFSPVVYELERIYDEYNHGNESPYAIKDFLRDAYQNWRTTPKHVLFIGDTGTENAFPVIKYQSSGAIGAIIAENWFVDIDDDFVIEMALGRLPITEVDELDSIITKIKNYDNMLDPRHENRAGILTGPGSVFRSQAQSYVNTGSPDAAQIDRIYIYDPDETGEFNFGTSTTDTLVKYINDGLLSLNYIGHGGGYAWDNHVLPYETFDEFEPGKSFIINSMTCYSNTFSNDNSIGEMFVRHPRGGVSILASTGFGWINSNYYLFEKVMQHMIYDNMSHGQALQYALTEYFFSTFGKNASFVDQIDGSSVYKYFRKSMFYQFCILGDPSVAFPVTGDENINITPQSISAGTNVNIQFENTDITHAYMDIVGVIGEDRKHPIKQKIDLDVVSGNAQFSLETIPEEIKSGLLQFTLWDDNKYVYTASASLAFNAPYVEELSFYPSQPNLLDDPVHIRLVLNSQESIDSVQLGVYSKKAFNSSHQDISLHLVEPGVYETHDSFVFLNRNQFYTVTEDTSIERKYYSGNYFTPMIYQADNMIQSDFYSLFPIVENDRDISILDFSIENGKSKLILFNQADTNSYVDVSVNVVSTNLNYSYKDTVLSIFDVDGQYEVSAPKINTYYFDILPAYGESNVDIRIQALDIVDADTTNDHAVFSIENNWVSTRNGHFINHSSDTCVFQNDGFQYILPASSESGFISISLSIDSTLVDLADYGAEQAQAQKFYLHSENDFSLMGAISSAKLNDGKMVAYFNQEEQLFYRLPVSEQQDLVLFPMNKSGYYLLAEAIDHTSPQIELNINAQEILDRAYVSERSDFSVLIKDNYGVNPLEEFWNVLLDGEEISEENISVISGDNIKELGINFKLDMEVGDHTLQVVAEDLVGNTAETEVYEIVYTGESQLINYGNFPNPFSTKTTFIYELTEQFDDLVIKIYTMSGRKIYTMSMSENATTDLPLHSIGYHEIPWSGVDEFGNSVANGVYFYVIEGRVDGKTIKTNGKVAKLWL